MAKARGPPWNVIRSHRRDDERLRFDDTGSSLPRDAPRTRTPIFRWFSVAIRIYWWKRPAVIMAVVRTSGDAGRGSGKGAPEAHCERKKGTDGDDVTHNDDEYHEWYVAFMSHENVSRVLHCLSTSVTNTWKPLSLASTQELVTCGVIDTNYWYCLTDWYKLLNKRNEWIERRDISRQIYFLQSNIKRKKREIMCQEVSHLALQCALHKVLVDYRSVLYNLN